MINANESNVIPRLRAVGKSPFDVSSTIPVVIVRVRYAILPPTIIIAPTSDNARLNDRRIFIVKSYFDSNIRVVIF